MDELVSQYDLNREGVKMSATAWQGTVLPWLRHQCRIISFRAGPKAPGRLGNGRVDSARPKGHPAAEL